MKLSKLIRQKMFAAKKKGFTLVEVLVVIIIIGALSSILMISAISAMDRAEATKIVSDLKSIQSASMLYFADQFTWPKGEISEIKDYLSTSLNDSKYKFVSDEKDSSIIHAVYKNDEIGAGVIAKLKIMQEKGSPIVVNEENKSVMLRLQG